MPLGTGIVTVILMRWTWDHRYQISTDCQVLRMEIAWFNSLVKEADRYAIPRKLSFSVIIMKGRGGCAALWLGLCDHTI